MAFFFPLIWHTTPVFLPENPMDRVNLAGFSSWGLKRHNSTESTHVIRTHTHEHTYMESIFLRILPPPPLLFPPPLLLLLPFFLIFFSEETRPEIMVNLSVQAQNTNK